MTLPFRLTWKCPHHPDGCEVSGKFSQRAVDCRNDTMLWTLYREAMKLAKPMMKKPDKQPVQAVEKANWVDSSFEKQWPYLASWLAEPVWDDGTVRQTGTLTVFVQEGILKACMNDRAMDRSCFISAPTMEALYDAMEAGLENDNHEWRRKKA